jgi:hypothetical protein
MYLTFQSLKHNSLSRPAAGWPQLSNCIHISTSHFLNSPWSARHPQPFLLRTLVPVLSFSPSQVRAHSFLPPLPLHTLNPPQLDTAAQLYSHLSPALTSQYTSPTLASTAPPQLDTDGCSALSLTHDRTHHFPPPPCFPISQCPRLSQLDTDPHNAHILVLHFPCLATLDMNTHSAHFPIPISLYRRHSHSHLTPRCTPHFSSRSRGHQLSPVPPTELATTTMVGDGGDQHGAEKLV